MADYGSWVGERIGDLIFVRVAAARSPDGRLLGEFACACGRTATYPAGRVLRQGARTHCGCKTDHGSSRTHGMRQTAEYRSWGAMKGRCLNPLHKDYHRWGGAGVTVEPILADSFQAFFEAVGSRPAGTTLDRIDDQRGYERGNLRWATAAEQAANRRDTWVVEINGVQHVTIKAAARALGVSTTTIVRWCDGRRPDCRRWRKYART